MLRPPLPLEAQAAALVLFSLGPRPAPSMRRVTRPNAPPKACCCHDRSGDSPPDGGTHAAQPSIKRSRMNLTAVDCRFFFVAVFFSFQAAHLMVSNLAGSLALVTCKEPLRVSIGNHMRSLLSTAVPTADQATTETLVHLCSSENLELGCMLIEKAATEKAMRDIDEAVAPALQARRKSRETTGQPFYDMSIFNNLRYPGALPDLLRPKPGGLHPQQLLVYEAFQRVPRQPSVTRSPAGPAVAAGPGGAQGPQGGGGGGAGPGSAGPSPRLLPSASPASPALGGMQGGGGAAAGGGRGLSPKGVVELTLEQALSAWQVAIARLDIAIGGLLAAQRRAGGPELTLHAANRDQELSASLQEVGAAGRDSRDKLFSLFFGGQEGVRWSDWGRARVPGGLIARYFGRVTRVLSLVRGVVFWETN